MDSTRTKQGEGSSGSKKGGLRQRPALSILRPRAGSANSISKNSSVSTTNPKSTDISRLSRRASSGSEATVASSGGLISRSGVTANATDALNDKIQRILTQDITGEFSTLGGIPPGGRFESKVGSPTSATKKGTTSGHLRANSYTSLRSASIHSGCDGDDGLLAPEREKLEKEKQLAALDKALAEQLQGYQQRRLAPAGASTGGAVLPGETSQQHQTHQQVSLPPGVSAGLPPPRQSSPVVDMKLQSIHRGSPKFGDQGVNLEALETHFDVVFKPVDVKKIVPTPEEINQMEEKKRKKIELRKKRKVFGGSSILGKVAVTSAVAEDEGAPTIPVVVPAPTGGTETAMGGTATTPSPTPGVNVLPPPIPMTAVAMRLGREVSTQRRARRDYVPVMMHHLRDHKELRQAFGAQVEEQVSDRKEKACEARVAIAKRNARATSAFNMSIRSGSVLSHSLRSFTPSASQSATTGIMSRPATRHSEYSIDTLRKEPTTGDEVDDGLTEKGMMPVNFLRRNRRIAHDPQGTYLRERQEQREVADARRARVYELHQELALHDSIAVERAAACSSEDYHQDMGSLLRWRREVRDRTLQRQQLPPTAISVPTTASGSSAFDLGDTSRPPTRELPPRARPKSRQKRTPSPQYVSSDDDKQEEKELLDFVPEPRGARYSRDRQWVVLLTLLEATDTFGRFAEAVQVERQTAGVFVPKAGIPSTQQPPGGLGHSSVSFSRQWLKKTGRKSSILLPLGRVRDAGLRNFNTVPTGSAAAPLSPALGTSFESIPSMSLTAEGAVLSIGRPVRPPYHPPNAVATSVFIATLRATCAPKRTRFWLLSLRLRALVHIRSFLRVRGHYRDLARRAHRFLELMQKLILGLKNCVENRVCRTEGVTHQFECYQHERMIYSRAMCADADRALKKLKVAASPHLTTTAIAAGGAPALTPSTQGLQRTKPAPLLNIDQDASATAKGSAGRPSVSPARTRDGTATTLSAPSPGHPPKSPQSSSLSPVPSSTRSAKKSPSARGGGKGGAGTGEGTGTTETPPAPRIDTPQFAVGRRVAAEFEQWEAEERAKEGVAPPRVTLPRLGKDPFYARLFSLSTLQELRVDKCGQKVSPKIKEFLAFMVVERERMIHYKRVKEWIEAHKEAQLRWDALMQLTSIYDHPQTPSPNLYGAKARRETLSASVSSDTVSGPPSPTLGETTSGTMSGSVLGRSSVMLQKQLEGFSWPVKPHLRALLKPNEMRLLVSLAYTLGLQEKRWTIESTRGIDANSPEHAQQVQAIRRHVCSERNYLEALRTHYALMGGAEKLPDVRSAFIAETICPVKIPVNFF